MPKLLDVIKEMGLSHEDAIKLLKENKDIKPDIKVKKPDVPDTKDKQTDKPDLETETSDDVDKEKKRKTAFDKAKEIADKATEIVKKMEADKTKEIEDAKAETELAEKVQEEVIKQLKIKRKTPSKGELREQPSVEYGISNRGYEVKTDRSLFKDELK